MSAWSAVAHGVLTLAFPSISTGIYGHPVDLAARIAIGTVRLQTQKFNAIGPVGAALRETLAGCQKSRRYRLIPMCVN
jgi:O-acetyl-ADP-ribose deacetylase (regulator of RNase III)